jgi:AcrR family transcriptional regulator/DNA-binding MarR family transcriptional regulator
MQRRRLLTATLQSIYEHGVQAHTVTLVTDRAGVSRKTFYDIFKDREGCLLATFEETVRQATETIERGLSGQERWTDKIRSGLSALLYFLDDEPVTGRLLIVEALGAGDRTLEARRRVLAQIIAIIDEGRSETKTSRQPPPLTAEGVVGAVFSVIHARMLQRDTRPLIELAGPLTAMVLQPYLGHTAAQRELKRPTSPPKRSTPRLPTDPFKDLSIRLTYRTARVLTAIAATPGASNKQIARASDIADEGQTSRLLTRLERYNLIHNTGGQPTKGEAKAWTLTTTGQEIVQAIEKG